MIKTKFKSIQRIYDDVRKYLLAGLVFVTCLVGIVPGLSGIPYLFNSFLCASCLLYLELFFKLYSSVVKKQHVAVDYFNGIHEMFPDVFNEIISRSKNVKSKKSRTKCRILSNSGHAGIPLFQSLLSRIISDKENFAKLSVDFEYYLMDIKFAEDFVFETPDRISRRSATIGTFKEFIKMNSEDLQAKDISICYCQYKFTPMLHGVLIDDDLLYMSHFVWDKAFSGSGRKFKKCQIGYEFDKEHIACFIDWFEHAKNGCDK